MKQSELICFYPAGGNVETNIEISQIKLTADDAVVTGKAILPLTDHVQKVVVYALELEDGSVDYRAVSAYCPHQGADISKDKLKNDGNVYCSLHKRPICIYSEYNQAYPVLKSDNQYFLKANQG